MPRHLIVIGILTAALLSKGCALAPDVFDHPPIFQIKGSLEFETGDQAEYTDTVHYVVFS